MPNQKLNDEDRRRIIDAYIARESVASISQLFQFKRPGIYAIKINICKAGDSILLQRKSGNYRQKLSNAP
ncbi:hypothetical protein ENBRE01_2192 [Enteropsectra breve]|nr:hypothetical protein ENBRE01_2192 [Enteropsectra breve]